MQKRFSAVTRFHHCVSVHLKQLAEQRSRFAALSSAMRTLLMAAPQILPAYGPERPSEPRS